MAAESSALNYAGRAYKRERGREFPPGEAGVWLLDKDGSCEAVSRLRPRPLDAGRSVPATIDA
jgi:hypothetical protein